MSRGPCGRPSRISSRREPWNASTVSGTYVTGPQVDSRLHLTSFSREMPETAGCPGLCRAVRHRGTRKSWCRSGVAAPARPPGDLREAAAYRGGRSNGVRGGLPSALFPGLCNANWAPYDVFASDYGVVASSGEQTVRAESADAHLARLLGIAKRAPLLVQERVTRAAERVIELSTSWYRADRYRIHMAVTPEALDRIDARRTSASRSPHARESWPPPWKRQHCRVSETMK